MSTDLLAALESQCHIEGDKKRSPFLADVLHLLLLSPTGQQLRDLAQQHRRDLVKELESNLVLLGDQLPVARIQELAAASQRYPEQMLVRLVLLGLRVYERAMAQMESDIEMGAEGMLTGEDGKQMAGDRQEV
jgi:hypothetical protein